MTDDCMNRLVNWKFNDAERYLDKEDVSEDANMVRILSRMFGNLGWQLSGDMHDIIDYIVSNILPPEYEG